MQISKPPQSHNEDLYLEAVEPTPCQILGVALKPFTVGHYALLYRFENAFLFGGDVRINDLLLGLWVCSQDYADASYSLRYEDIGPVFEDFAKQVGPIKLEEKASLFAEYIKTSCQGPEVWHKDKQRQSVAGCPSLGVIRITLMRELNLSPSEVMDYPFGLAMWDIYGAQEQTGGLQIVSDDERSKRKAADEFFQRWQGGSN